MSQPLVRQCAHCANLHAPVVCAKCKVAAYCTDQHLSTDASTHRMYCKAIVNARKRFLMEEKKLRKQDPDIFDYADGAFYLEYETRPYMHAKHDFIVALSKNGSFLAIQEALKEATDSLRLNEQDDLWTNESVPALLLLLGKVNKAYDFLRYWATFDDSAPGDDDDDDEDGDDEEEEEEEKPAPCMRAIGADLTEPVDVFLTSPFPISKSVFHSAGVTYIKIMASFAANGAIRQLMDMDLEPSTKAAVLQFLQSNRLPTDIQQLVLLKDRLERDAQQAFALTHRRNAYYWRAMLTPSSLIKDSRYDDASPSKVAEWLAPNARLWELAPAAREFVASQCAQVL